MKQRESRIPASRPGRRPLAALWLVAAVAAATPASAYVVVTADNRVYDVPTRPSLEGDLVLFSLAGAPVALRVYDVNVRATNVMNGLIDQGVTGARLMREMDAMPEATPYDQRLIVAAPLHSLMGYEKPAAVDVDLGYGRYPAPPSYSAATGVPESGMYESRGMAMPPPSSSGFEAEARAAMDRAARGGDAPPSSTRMMPATSEVAELDAEIAAEQEYLRQLTAGEVVVDDLDREIERSMSRVARLQRRRARLAEREGAMAAPPAMAAPMSAPRSAGSPPPSQWPVGSREASTVAELQARLERLERQRAEIPPGASQEREVIDELIGETRYRLERLRRR